MKRVFAWGAYSILAFYLPIWVSHEFLPKWWDVVGGLIGSFILLYYGAAYFLKIQDGK